MRILIVDDDPTTTHVLEKLLQGAGFDTLCAYDLAGAEALAHDHAVSLILLDVHLPDGNGLDLCERLTADPSLEGLPILFISANDDLSVKVRGFAAGAVDYITKPLAGAEVLARVRTHLRLRAAYESLAALQAERIQRLSASQQSLMPKPQDLPEAGFQAYVRQNLQAGGDFYDVVPSGTRITDYVVADASGHDLGATLWTASFKTLMSEYASALYTPPDLCRMINNALRRVLPEAAYFTAIYARLNRSVNRLMLVNAGHPAAILVSNRERESSICHQEGDILGVFPDPVFGVMEVPVKPGDRLFLYTDGLVEKSGKRQDGMQQLMAACRATIDVPMADALPIIVRDLYGTDDAEDDIILLGIEV